jgi:hypothetical protein
MQMIGALQCQSMVSKHDWLLLAELVRGYHAIGGPHHKVDHQVDIAACGYSTLIGLTTWLTTRLTRLHVVTAPCDWFDHMVDHKVDMAACGYSTL